jgi:hypothetical protein
MLEEPRKEIMERYFATDQETFILKMHMELYFAKGVRDPARARIVQGCSTILQSQSPHWTTRRVSLYFHNHRRDHQQINPKEKVNQPKVNILKQPIYPEATIDLSMNIPFDPITIPSEELSENLLNTLHLKAKLLKRFHFIHFESLDTDISDIFAGQNSNNQLPPNSVDCFTYLDELLLNFNNQEKNLLENIPHDLKEIIILHTRNSSSITELSQTNVKKGVLKFISQKNLKD